MAKKELVLIGAGKIGRGYIADLFNTAGYKLTFLEYSEALVQKLRAQGYYTVFRSHSDKPGYDKAVIRGYDAFCTQTEYEQCLNAIANTNYVSIHVFPGACESIGHMLGDAVKLRYQNGNTEPLDLLFCVNFVYPGDIFKKYMLERLNEKEAAFMEEHVGFVESLVYRLGADPMPDMRAEDELSILSGDNAICPWATNGRARFRRASSCPCAIICRRGWCTKSGRATRATWPALPSAREKAISGLGRARTIRM